MRGKEKEEEGREEEEARERNKERKEERKKEGRSRRKNSARRNKTKDEKKNTKRKKGGEWKLRRCVSNISLVNEVALKNAIGKSTQRRRGAWMG